MSERDPKVSTEPRHYVVGVSGASGALYAVRLVQSLLAAPSRIVHLTATPAGVRVMRDEVAPPAGPNCDRGEGGGLSAYFSLGPDEAGRLRVYPCADIGAPIAGGTFLTEAMIVVPCSMNTLAAVAGGLQSNLLTRAAAVTLKEGRPLVLVPRETPLGLVELRNMVAATEAGAVVLPANPGFYHHPATIEDLVGFIVQKIMDRLGLEVADPVRWGEETGPRPREKRV